MDEVLLFTECNGSIGWGRDAGAYTIASALRSNGVSTRVFDFFSHFNTSLWKILVDRYVTEETLCLAFSSTHFSSLHPDNWESHFKNELRGNKNQVWNTYFPQSPEQIEEWFDYARAKNPKLKIVVGGQKVAQKRKLQDKYPMVDHWIGGMSEKSILAVIDNIREQKSNKKYIKSEADYGSVSETEFAKSFMQWREKDFITKGEALPIELSRGCPFRCSFCDYRKKKRGSWIKDWGLAREHFISNWERFGVNHYMISDFLVNESLEKIEDLRNVVVDLPFEFNWSGFGRIDLLQSKPEMITLMQESGLKSIQWGIETIEAKAGPAIGKVTEQKTIESLLQKCRDQWGDEVVMGSGFVVGLPGETEDTAKNLFQWLTDQPWLNGWEVTPLFIGQFNEDKAYTIDFSNIQKNPQKYGYEVTMEKQKLSYKEEWKTETFSKTMAIELIEEYQQSDNWKKRILTTFHGYSRAHNLGFSPAEIRKCNHEDEKWIDVMATRYRAKASEYLKKALELD